MIRLFVITALFMLSSYTPDLLAQRAVRQSGATIPSNTVRARSLYQTGDIATEELRWKREIYRLLDMEKEEKNMPLYFPIEPQEGRRNLFATLFDPLCKQRITAYEYLDGNEKFSDSTRITVKEVMDKFHILYKETGSGRVMTYAVDDSDVPSGEVKSYFVKELYYFDHRTSEFRVEIEAICPVLHREGEFGDEVVKYPMFWIKYDDLRPFLHQTRIMASNLNNATTYSMDDYISRRLYKGDIYKATNLRNLTLMQYCPTPDSLERERKRIELQLVAFEKGLWSDTAVADSITPIPQSRSVKATRSVKTTKSQPKISAPSRQAAPTGGGSSVRTVRRK